MTREQIEAVAEFFTGPTVVYSSIMLDVSQGRDPAHAKMARIFFESRAKLGIQGYASKEEAMNILKGEASGEGESQP